MLILDAEIVGGFQRNAQGLIGQQAGGFRQGGGANLRHGVGLEFDQHLVRGGGGQAQRVHPGDAQCALSVAGNTGVWKSAPEQAAFSGCPFKVAFTDCSGREAVPSKATVEPSTKVREPPHFSLEAGRVR